jgi:hypothetical protein
MFIEVQYFPGPIRKAMGSFAIMNQYRADLLIAEELKGRDGSR